MYTRLPHMLGTAKDPKGHLAKEAAFALTRIDAKNAVCCIGWQRGAVYICAASFCEVSYPSIGIAGGERVMMEAP